MAKPDLSCERDRSLSGTIERTYFSTVDPLVLSERSQRLRECPFHAWVFQLIQIYQGKRNFQDVDQVWSFTKTEGEVLALCEDPQGNLLTFFGINLLEFHEAFQEITIYVSKGKCMMKEEHDYSLAGAPGTF